MSLSNLKITQRNARWLVLITVMVISSLYMQGALSSNKVVTSENPSKCLVFSKDQLINKVKKFKKKYGIYSSNVIYSASFDLNDDGKKEYFYYLDSPGSPYCGNMSLQVGCPIQIVRYAEKSNFIFLDDGSIFPGLDFHPLEHQGYICILLHKTAGWYDFIVNDGLIYQVNDERFLQLNNIIYKLIHKKD